MVTELVRVLVAVVLVMGVAGPVAAGEEMAEVAGAELTALTAAGAPSATDLSGAENATGKVANSAVFDPWHESSAAVSQKVSTVSAGSQHTCTVTASGGAKCWGWNLYGQLGNGTTTDSSTPVDVVGLASGVTTVDAGYLFTCALTAGGGVKCWGWNDHGQLGNGTTNNSTTPVDVVGLSSGVTALSAGSYHTCALTSGGGVKCWGANDSGQLGDGTTTEHWTPVDVAGLSNGVVAVSAGDSHTCALTTEGGAKCWGYNAYGQLGNGTGSSSSTPVDVIGLSSGVAAVSAGGRHTCAAVSVGGSMCWGDNAYGQLGDGTTTRSYVPIEVVGLAGEVFSISAGLDHSCAASSSDGARCWGYNYYGQLGDGTSGQSRTLPVEVKGLSNGAAGISAGGKHSCAVTVGGGVKCWGDDYYGQLGPAATRAFSVPMDVEVLPSAVTAVSCGSEHTCTVTAAGGVDCWGLNQYGQLGDGMTDNSYISMGVVGLSSGVTAVSAGGRHSCALTSGGGVKCWGMNEHGQLGDGTSGYGNYSSVPVNVVGFSSGAVTVSTGLNHTCAVTAAGGAKCWGWNGYGQLGDGTTTSSNTPVDVVGLASGVAAVSAGGYHTCALTASGGVKCWGYNGYGQLGDGAVYNGSPVPVDVVGLSSGVTAVSAGEYHTCALTTSGGVKCWGNNERGQLGDGTTTTSSTPVDVVGLSSGVAAIDTGWFHTCALTTGGGAKCWGYNEGGQLGDGTKNNSSIPVDVAGLSSGVAAVSTGSWHTCALTTGGGLQCWGANYGGQMGVNPGWSPVDVLGLEGSVYTTIAKSGTSAVLTWLHMVSAVDHYEVYRGTTTPYFEPGGPGSEKLPTEPPAPPDTATEVTFTDTGVLGSPGSYFYAVVPVNEGGESYATSNRTGAFNYGMTPGSGLRRR